MIRTTIPYPSRRATRPPHLVAVAALALAGACAMHQEPRRLSSEGKVLVRVVAANITSGRFQSYDPGHGTRILQGIDPQVVLLQEFNVGDNTEAELDTWVTSTFGDGADYIRGGERGIPNGVISTLPILEAGVWRDPHVNNRDFSYARIDVPGERELWAVSVHLLTKNSSSRSAQAREIVDYVRDEVPEGDYLVIGGDFNTNSRGEHALDVLGGVVEVNGPYPADHRGNPDTNASRSKPYDAVYAEDDLESYEVPVVLGTSDFPHGAVIDTRVYEPISDIAPAQRNDSGASNMQHMAVVRDFALPGGSAPGPDAGRPPVVDAGAPDADPVEPDADPVHDAAAPDAAPPDGEPLVIINEVLANEPGSDTSGEFVEIVNVGDGEADLSGWTISDASAVRHEFRDVQLAPREAWVVSGSLSLANGGDSAVLHDADNLEIDRVDYERALTAEDGVSMNRSDDGRPGAAFVLHTDLAGAASSPNTRVNGAPF